MPKKKIETSEEQKIVSPRRKKKEASIPGKESVEGAAAKKENKKIKTVSWRAAEYERVEKSTTWYASIIGGSLLVALIAFWSGNLFFGVFILCAGGLILFFSGRHPQILEFEITDEGVEIKDKMKMTFESLQSFSVRARPYALNELILRKKTNINPFVRIPIDATLAEKVKVLLRTKISEVEYEESIIDLISDRFGL